MFSTHASTYLSAVLTPNPGNIDHNQYKTMPETAPLDVNDTSVGYELDSITMRNISTVRYVRHHEWLDHLLESPVPSSNIVPTPLGDNFDFKLIENRIKQLEKEISELDAEDFSGTKFYFKEDRTVPIIEATRVLHENFGKEHTDKVQQDIEVKLGSKIRPETTKFPVKITYDRRKIEIERALKAQKDKEEEKEKERNNEKQNSEEKNDKEKEGGLSHENPENQSSSLSAEDDKMDVEE